MPERVAAYHIVLAAYGFWLPNDPRGSWSLYVGSRKLFAFGGAAARVNTHASVAAVPHDRAARLAMKQHLKAPSVRFTGKQALEIARAFAAAGHTADYCIYACAIMPDHVHLVVERHLRRAEGIAGHLKYAATRRLYDLGLYPRQHWAGSGKRPSMWAARSWCVFLAQRDMPQTIKYVENNPVEAGLRPQRWSFVKPFEL